MTKTTVAKSLLAEKTLQYWQASYSWNGKGSPTSLAKQNTMLRSAQDGRIAGFKVFNLAGAQIERTIKYGDKPKKGLTRYKKTSVQQLRKVK